MADIPRTSITLLTDLAADAANARWSEFVRHYDGLMRAFLREHYPSAEEDDVLQETLLALMKALPDYHYTPDEHGYFHDYLLGILKHKATDQLRRRAHENEKRTLFHRERDCHRAHPNDAARQTAILHAALDQLMADSSIAPRNLEIFRHVALLHEPPELVAAQFGTTRGNVDVIKKRLTDRLAALARAMTKSFD